MPILAPPGALPAAFRVICLRSARAFGRGEVVDYAFHKLSSKKCSNCTRLNDKCIPIPDYVEEEFDRFWEALVAFEGGDDSEKDALLRAVTPLGKELGNVVFVTTAGMKDTTTAQVIEASHRELVALRRGQEVQRNQLAMLLEDKEERDKEKEREREKRKGKGRSATAEFEGALGGDEGEFLE